MENNIEQTTIDVIETMANKLGVGIEHFYPQFVQQQVVEGMINVTIIFAVVTIAILLARHLYKATKSERGFQDENMPAMIALFLFGFMSLMLVITELSDQVTKITNPEYHALKAISEMINPTD